jgi:hypothetical protein
MRTRKDLALKTLNRVSFFFLVALRFCLFGGHRTRCLERGMERGGGGGGGGGAQGGREEEGVEGEKNFLLLFSATLNLLSALS